MKSVLIAVSALTALTFAASAASAAPGYAHRGHGVSGAERAAIARSASHLAQLKRHVWADGRVSFVERMKLRSAESRHAALVARAHRS